MRTPKATYNLDESSVIDEHLSENAWSALLDSRYKVEVQRTEPYKGVLCIWDARNDDALMFEKEVGISYDATFGVDIVDRCLWEDIVLNFIDDANVPSVS